MDALMLLTADHNRVRGLFSRYQSAQEQGDTNQAIELAGTILRELDVHTEIEEQVFYPGVAEADEEIRSTVMEGIEEHHVVKHLAREVQGLQAGSEAWEAKLKVIIENVEHHAQEEEEELFPEVSKACNQDVLVELARRMEALKSRLGAPTVADKESFSTKELKELAKAQQVPGRSSMRREELLATVAPG